VRILILCLALGGDERKAREAVCPLDAHRFPVIEITATNTWGGRDADGCPHAFKTRPLEFRVWVCPSCHFAGRPADFSGGLTGEEKEGLKGGLKAPLPIVRGARQEQIPGWAKYDLLAQGARLRKQPPQAEALARMHAAWAARQEGARDFGDLAEWDALRQPYGLLQTPMQYGPAKNRTELDLSVARRLEKDLADGRYERGANRTLARYLSAYLWRKHGELAETERSLARLKAVQGENSVVDQAAEEMAVSLSRERGYLEQALEAWVRAIDGKSLGAKELPQASYLVGELHRRLGRPEEALSWYGKAQEGADPALQKLLAVQRSLIHAK
jgi:tetratricopeptide (TPR) repeat protein